MQYYLTNAHKVFITEKNAYTTFLKDKHKLPIQQYELLKAKRYSIFLSLKSVNPSRLV